MKIFYIKQLEQENFLAKNNIFLQLKNRNLAHFLKVKDIALSVFPDYLKFSISRTKKKIVCAKYNKNVRLKSRRVTSGQKNYAEERLS